MKKTIFLMAMLLTLSAAAPMLPPHSSLTATVRTRRWWTRRTRTLPTRRA